MPVSHGDGHPYRAKYQAVPQAEENIPDLEMRGKVVVSHEEYSEMGVGQGEIRI